MQYAVLSTVPWDGTSNLYSFPEHTAPFKLKLHDGLKLLTIKSVHFQELHSQYTVHNNNQCTQLQAGFDNKTHISCKNLLFTI